MNTILVEQIQNIMVSVFLLNTSSFTFNISKVNFIPDAVIVKGIIYTPAADDPGATAIYTDLVSDYIGSFLQNISIEQNLTFILKKPVFGTYTFSIMTSIQNGTLVNRDGDLFIHLEFVKYKEQKPDKIY